MTYNVVKVARAPLMVCLQCPLCCNLVHEATTISECLHTFCRDCIYQRFGDGESDCCPICNVSLGCSPLEKLRADHQLDDVCAKIFPLRSRKRTVILSGSDVLAPPPVRRKERSLSSLGIGAALPSANPGFVNRKTKSLSRSVTIRDTSADEVEDGNKASEKFREFDSGNGLSETEYSTGALPEGDILDGKAVPISDEKPVSLISVKREICLDGKRSVNRGLSQWRRKEKFPSVKRTPLPKKMLEEPPPRSNPLMHGNNSLSNLHMHLAERPKISSTGLLCSQIIDASEHGKGLSCKEEAEPLCGYKLKSHVPILERRQRLGRSSRNLSTLACLAEVAVDHAGQVGSSQHTGDYRAGAHAARSHRERRKRCSIKAAALGESFVLHAEGESNGPSSQLYSWLPPLQRTSAGLDKLPVVRSKSSSTNGGTSTKAVYATKHNRRQVGLWFSLQAAENQIGESALPQISTRYLRIKDGKLPVSIVKKYLAKKLDLKSEAEVEITCRGQPVVPSLPLESIQGIWFATAIASDLLPSQNNEENIETNNGKRWAPTCGSSAKEYMMVLTYGRNHRNSQ
eukprot:c27506_g1_i2 orf=212-1924(+)